MGRGGEREPTGQMGLSLPRDVAEKTTHKALICFHDETTKERMLMLRALPLPLNYEM